MRTTGAMRICPTSSLEHVGLTTLHLNIQMQARREIFRMTESTREAESCPNRKKIDIVSIPNYSYREMSLTMDFHFDKKFET